MTSMNKTQTPLEIALKKTKVCIVAGAGGVGKTTVSAAIALHLARQGKRVAVITIDPAKRLADALGIDDLAPEPQQIDPELIARTQGEKPSGELWAMMLDVRHAFDDLIASLAPDEKTHQEILENRIYRQFSQAISGSQEFMAVAKIYELDNSDRFDVLILDTPPSRNALDFLEAPDRLQSFFEGRAIRVFLAPTGIAARLVGRGTSVVFSVLGKLIGTELLEDIGVFFRALGGLIDGFNERAKGIRLLLARETTTFLIVTSPEYEPAREAIFFAQKLKAAAFGLSGLIINRVQNPSVLTANTEHAQVELEQHTNTKLAQQAADALHSLRLVAERDQQAIEQLCAEINIKEATKVIRSDEEIHDIEGLFYITDMLFPPKTR